MKPYREECVWWLHLWVTNQRAAEGPIYENMRESRRQYVYAARRLKRQESNLKKTEDGTSCVRE